MPNYFDDYVNEFRSLGEVEFNRTYRAPVLIGLGIVGELMEDGQRGNAQTFLANLYDDDDEVKSLMRRVWPLLKGEYGPPVPWIRVGRVANNDVVINDYSISKHHCEFRRSEGMMAIVDLDSHNGIMVGGHHIPAQMPIEVQDEDEIVFGRYKFEYLSAQTFLNRVKTVALAST
jgi:hypothetical protein